MPDTDKDAVNWATIKTNTFGKQSVNTDMLVWKTFKMSTLWPTAVNFNRKALY